MLSGRPKAWCWAEGKRNTPQCARDESQSDNMRSKSLTKFTMRSETDLLRILARRSFSAGGINRFKKRKQHPNLNHLPSHLKPKLKLYSTPCIPFQYA